jgi:putative oxygen-independent coproporphyrinogen III oxidase
MRAALPPVVADDASTGEAPAPPRSAAQLLRPGVLSLAALPPLALYVHVPWCLRKCPYCDFNSHATPDGSDAVPEQAYLDALRADLEGALPLVWGRPIVSIFIGGGTPSLLSGAAVARLMSDLRALLPLSAGCEVTLEANPGTFEQARFEDYRAAGITRLSIGVQSFDDGCLRRLGRVHDAAQAIAAVECARALFEHLNCDLMYALPGQGPADLRGDVERLLALGVPHASLYELTLEPNTVFAKYPPPLPDEDAAAAMQEWLGPRMDAAGFEHYETSAFALPRHRCVHNLNYWHFGDYLGIGAGAHSKLSFPHRIVRQVRFRQPARYLAGASRGVFIAEDRDVARDDLPFEFMLNALRLNEGFATGLFAARTGMPASAIDPVLERLARRGLLTADAERIAPTPLGRRFLNELQSEFLPAD